MASMISCGVNARTTKPRVSNRVSTPSCARKGSASRTGVLETPNFMASLTSLTRSPGGRSPCRIISRILTITREFLADILHTKYIRNLEQIVSNRMQNIFSGRQALGTEEPYPRHHMTLNLLFSSFVCFLYCAAWNEMEKHLA